MRHEHSRKTCFLGNNHLWSYFGASHAICPFPEQMLDILWLLIYCNFCKNLDQLQSIIISNKLVQEHELTTLNKYITSFDFGDDSQSIWWFLNISNFGDMPEISINRAWHMFHMGNGCPINISFISFDSPKPNQLVPKIESNQYLQDKHKMDIKFNQSFFTPKSRQKKTHC